MHEIPCLNLEDGTAGQKLIIETLESANIKVLSSESVYPIPGDHFIELVGLGDSTTRWSDFEYVGTTFELTL